MKKSHFTPAEFGGYIPHRPPMLMIDEVIFADPELESGEAFYVPGNRPMAGLNPDGSLPSHVIMEVMAQGCAAVLGVCRMLRGEPPMTRALLLSVRGFQIRRRGAFPAGQRLLISVSRELKDENFVIMNVEAFASAGAPEDSRAADDGGAMHDNRQIVASGRFSLIGAGDAGETDPEKPSGGAEK